MPLDQRWLAQVEEVFLRVLGGRGTPATVPVLIDGADVVWTNMPLAQQELLGATAHRVPMPLNAVRLARLMANVTVVGAAAAQLAVQQSADQVSWGGLDGATGPSVNINATGLVVSAWVRVDGAALKDRVLRVVGSGGDGAADPAFRWIGLQLR